MERPGLAVGVGTPDPHALTEALRAHLARSRGRLTRQNAYFRSTPIVRG